MVHNKLLGVTESKYVFFFQHLDTTLHLLDINHFFLTF